MFYPSELNWIDAFSDAAVFGVAAFVLRIAGAVVIDFAIIDRCFGPLLHRDLPEIWAVSGSSDSRDWGDAHEAAATRCAAFLRSIFAMVVLITEVGVTKRLTRVSGAKTGFLHVGTMLGESRLRTSGTPKWKAYHHRRQANQPNRQQ